MRSSVTAAPNASARTVATRSGALPVLDAWAVLAFYEDHACADDVFEAIDGGDAIISAINLGEALYQLEREVGPERAAELVEALRSVTFVEEPDWDLVCAAAHLKAGGGLSYADCFCAATAQRHGAALYTGDPEIVALELAVPIVDLRAGR
jgi:PIN domain nuclease of toxin-antitoxin system